MNMNCLHSYCKECIEQRASTSLLCPITFCNSSLPSPLSSLPINFTLCYWQTLSPPLPSFTLPSQPLPEDIQKKCENCEENKAEVHCRDCKYSLCVPCSDSIHLNRIMKNHSISHLTTSPYSNKSGTSPIIHYHGCELHNQREMELYCVTCNKCVCVDCIDESHSNHSTKSVLKEVENIKEEWKRAVEIVSNDFTKNNKSIDSHLHSLPSKIDRVNGEIKLLVEKLKSLKETKENLVDEMRLLKESKEKIIQTTTFLFSFIQSLPPLPLSSFFPSSSIYDYIKEGKREARIRDFFEKEKLFSLFTSLLPLTMQSNFLRPTTNIFGTIPPGTSSTSIYRPPATTNIFGSTKTSTNIFGVTPPTPSPNIFGSTPTSATSTPSTNIFGTTSANIF